MATEVVQDDATSRFEIREDGVRVGHIDFRIRGDEIVLVHTEIDPARQGEGLAGTLVLGALDLIRAGDLRVVPQCPYVAAWIERHPDAQDLTTR